MRYIAFLIASNLSFSTSASAFPRHALHCSTTGQNIKVQAMDFLIEESNIKNGLGKVILSDWVIPPNVGEVIEFSDCGIIDGPCKSYVTPGWKRFEATEVQANILWANRRPADPGSRAITGLKINLGRAGEIDIQTSGAYDKYDTVHGRMVSNMRRFNYPLGIEISCQYFLVSGPRPGLTGSN